MSNRERHSEALLGIYLSQTGRTAQGAPPSDEELVLLSEGRLDETRRTEILSHLAARPERYRQWTSLIEMETQQQSTHSSLLNLLGRGLNYWLVDWRYALGGIGALAAVLLIVNRMALPPSETPQLTSTESQQVTMQAQRSLSLEKRAVEESATAKPKAAPATVQSYARERLGEAADMAEASGMDAATAISSPEPFDVALDPKNPPAPVADSAAGMAAAPQRFSISMAKPEPPALAEAGSASNKCIGLLHPETAVAGSLCALDGATRLEWQTARIRQSLGTLPEPLFHLSLSDDQQWLALQTHTHIYIQSIEDLLGNNRSRAALTFSSDTATIHWEGKDLVISVLQALGDSDDDIKYHYNPVIGELMKP